MHRTLSKDTSVLFITIDAARTDIVGRRSSDVSPTPFINGLFKDNFTLSSCYSTGYPTQFALPGLITSTLPLDYGGYDKGIHTRPSTISEPFKRNGTETIAFTNGFAPNHLFGYDRGFQHFYHLTSLGSWLGSFMSIYSRYYVENYSGNLASSELASYGEFVGQFLPHLRDWCYTRQREAVDGEDHLKYLSPRLHGIDWDRAISVIEGTINEHNEDPDQFVRGLIHDYPDIDFIDQLRDSENWNGISLPISKSQLLKFYTLKLMVGINPYLTSVAKNKGVRPLLGNVKDWITDQQISTGSSSSGYVFANLFEYLHGVEGPFFGWTHLTDAHSNNYFSWELQDKPCPYAGASVHLEEEFASHMNYLRAVGTSRSYKSSPKYDLGARTIDVNLEKFLNNLYDSLDDHPLLVITADHGHEVMPLRSGHHATHFYDELLHIPVAFIHPSLPRDSFDGLCSSMDIAPTLLDMLGFDIPTGFQGTPVSQLPDDGRDYILAEDYGRGPIDPAMKSPNVCVRTNRRKLLYSTCEPGRPETAVKSAYDLNSDPLEQNPLDTDSIGDGFNNLIEWAQKRTAQIEESVSSPVKPVSTD